MSAQKYLLIFCFSFNSAVAQQLCNDMGAENGWGSWLGDVGIAQSGTQTWSPPPVLPSSPNFFLTNGTSIDPCTPGPNPGDPPIPLVAPNFGNASIMIGQPMTANSVAEQLTYQLTVTPQDTNFIFSYAIILQDAGHVVADQPFVSLCIYDSNGNQIPCGCFKYTGGPSLPDFYQANCGGSGTFYKPWTTAGVNLASYVGQTLTIVITNVDCAQGAHWTYSYWDFSCGTFLGSSGSSSSQCGQPDTLCAPSDPAIAYTYQWYQNGNPYTGPNATSQCITPIPQQGDTFVVAVYQPQSGCTFYMTYAPNASAVVASIMGATSICSGGVTTLTASGGINYSWSTGATTTSITISPSTTTTYSVIVSSGTCTDTAFSTITVTNSITAAANNSTICSGSTATLTATGGTNYLWNTGATTAAINVSSAGTYSVIVSSGICSDTAYAALTVNPNPTAAVSGNVAITQGQSTTLTASGGGTYLWSNGETNPSVFVSPLTTSVYCVTVTDINNCTDTACVTIYVEPLPCKNVFVPNAFSPNDDGENDILFVYGNCISEMDFKIYNRWGERVFETREQNKTWDGMYRGTVLNTGVFTYFLNGTYTDGETFNVKGNITLIR